MIFMPARKLSDMEKHILFYVRLENLATLMGIDDDTLRALLRAYPEFKDASAKLTLETLKA